MRAVPTFEYFRQRSEALLNTQTQEEKFISQWLAVMYELIVIREVILPIYDWNRLVLEIEQTMISRYKTEVISMYEKIQKINSFDISLEPFQPWVQLTLIDQKIRGEYIQ